MSMFWWCVFLFSSRRRHTICALVTGVQTCALPIFDLMLGPVARHDNQLGHASPSSVSCRRRYVARCAPNQALLSAALGTKGEYAMGLSQQQLNAGIDALADRDATFARARGTAGYTEQRIRAPGSPTLPRTIVGARTSTRLNSRHSSARR